MPPRCTVASFLASFVLRNVIWKLVALAIRLVPVVISAEYKYKENLMLPILGEREKPMERRFGACG